MTIVPQFPLGSVLLPHMLLPLVVFEPRYRQLVADLDRHDQRFGVVLIDRGSEVGGGEIRGAVGTIARVRELATLPDGRSTLVCVGTERFRVVEWLPDDPYPLADVEPWPDDPDDPGTADEAAAMFAGYDRCRDIFTRNGIDVGPRPAFDPELAVSTYQVTASSPLGDFDRRQILLGHGAGERARRLADHLDLAATTLAFRLGEG